MSYNDKFIGSVVINNSDIPMNGVKGLNTEIDGLKTAIDGLGSNIICAVENQEKTNSEIKETIVQNVNDFHKIADTVLECLESDRKRLQDLYDKHFFVVKLIQYGFFFTNLFFIIIFFVYVWSKH